MTDHSKFLDEDAKHAGSSSCAAPDWFFDTDDQLQAHAAELAEDAQRRLAALNDSHERPAGTLPHTVIQLPCHDPDDYRQQLKYLGYFGDACQRNKLMVRGVDVSAEEGVFSVFLCQADDFIQAKLEDEASSGLH